MNRPLFAFLGLLTFSAFAAEPKWIHVPSADFEIFSSVGEGDTRRVLQHFERVRTFFEAKIPSSAKHRAEPIKVIVFGSKKEYEQYRPNDFAAAFYTQIAGRDYIVLGGVTDDVFPVAVHEYVHLVAQHAGLNLPPWLNEGMAELYSTLKPVGDKVIVGNIIPGRIYEMTQQKWTPLAAILAAGSDSPYYNEKNKAGSLYDEGWALTHMLQLSPEYSPRFGEFFRQVAAGTPSDKAIEGVYGKPVSAVEKDVQGYIRRDSFTGVVFPVKLDSGAKAVIEPADSFEVRLSLIDLSNRSGREAETRQKLNELAKDFPRKPEPQSALGYLAWRTNQRDQAVQAFGAAFDLGGRNPQMPWDYGRLAANSDADHAILALNALLEGEPERIDVRLALAGIQLSHQKAKDALATLSPVKKIDAKDAPRLFELLAFSKAQTGDMTGAREDGLRWITNARADDDRARGKSFVQSLERSLKPVMAQASSLGAPPHSGTPDAGPPKLTRSETTAPGALKMVRRSATSTADGVFKELDCSGTAPKFIMQTNGGNLTLLLDQPDKVILSGVNGATVDMQCGTQKPVSVHVEYEPSAAPAGTVKGSVTAIRFEAESPAR